MKKALAIFLCLNSLLLSVDFVFAQSLQINPPINSTTSSTTNVDAKKTSALKITKPQQKKKIEPKKKIEQKDSQTPIVSFSNDLNPQNNNSGNKDGRAHNKGRDGAAKYDKAKGIAESAIEKLQKIETPPPQECLECSLSAAGITYGSPLKSCELGIGKDKVLSLSDQHSDTKVNKKYRLTRAGLNDYVAELRISFTASPNLSTTMNSQELQKHYTEGLQKCLDDINPKLLGPDHKKLQIKLSTDTKVPLSEIKIKEPKSRSDSEKYAADINCETSTHELMHLLGLVDEYEEQKLGYHRDPNSGETKLVEKESGDKAFNCRYQGPEDSIMRHQYRAFASVFPTQRSEIHICDCKTKPCSADFLKNTDSANKKSSPEQSCPSGHIRESRIVTHPPGTDPVLAKGLFSPPAEVIVGTVQLPPKPPTGTSLLKPAHFRMITSPNCGNENRLYLACAQNSDLTTSDRLGRGCLDAPPECRSESTWLR